MVWTEQRQELQVTLSVNLKLLSKAEEITNAILEDDIVDIGRIQRFFTNDVWKFIMDIVKTKKETAEWFCEPASMLYKMERLVSSVNAAYSGII